MRIEALAQLGNEVGADACVVLDPASIAYFTGVWIAPGERLLALVVRGREYCLLVPALEAAALPDGIAHRALPDGQDPADALASLLAAGERVGLQLGRFPLGWWQGLQERLPGIRPVDIGPGISALRAVKDRAEQDRLRRAATLTDRALDYFLSRLREGVTERQLAAELEGFIVEELGAEPAFPTIVLAGENTALPHGRPGSRPVREHEPVLVDFGVAVEGYRADLTRTVVLGDPPPEVRALHDAVRRAQEAAVRRLAPGVPVGEVDREAREALRQAGWEGYMPHRLGHGLGLEIHEAPFLVSGGRDMLLPGHVVTVEPGLYVPGVGGVRVEDDFLLTPEGVEPLTHAPRSLTGSAEIA